MNEILYDWFMQLRWKDKLKLIVGLPFIMIFVLFGMILSDEEDNVLFSEVENSRTQTTHPCS